MTDFEQAREQIAKQIAVFDFGCPMAEMDKAWPNSSEGQRLIYLERADRILSLKGSGWHMAIVQDGAELSEAPEYMGTYKEYYEHAQQDMLDAGWVKEIKE